MKELVFTLTTTAGTFVLDPSPDGWDESMVSWERSDKYWGVIRSWTVPLKFIKTGALEVRREFYTHGMKASAELKIERLNKITMVYSIAYSGILDFSTFKDTEYSIDCTFKDSGLAAILKDKSGTEYISGNGAIGAWNDDPNFRAFGAEWSYKYNGNYYAGIKMTTLATNLLNFMTKGGFQDGTYLFKSDFLATYDDVLILSPGKAFRLPNVEKPGDFKTTFDDWFKSVSSIFNLGLGIETDPDTGKEVLRVEPKTYFFAPGVTVDFGNVGSLVTSINSKLAWGKVKIGFEKKEYTDAALLVDSEINGTSSWECDNSTSTQELDLVSKFRGDGSGIMDIILTETENNDDDIFFVLLKDFGTHYEIDPDGVGRQYATPGTEFIAWNWLISPRRSLERWRSFLSSCNIGLSSDYLLFTSGDNSMAYRESGQSGVVFLSESEKWLITSGYIFYPVQFEIEVAAPADMIAKVAASPTGLYQFNYKGVDYLGHLVKIDAKISGRATQKITLLANGSTSFSHLIR